MPSVVIQIARLPPRAPAGTRLLWSFAAGGLFGWVQREMLEGKRGECQFELFPDRPEVDFPPPPRELPERFGDEVEPFGDELEPLRDASEPLDFNAADSPPPDLPAEPDSLPPPFPPASVDVPPPPADPFFPASEPAVAG